MTEIVAQVPVEFGAPLAAGDKTYHSIQRGCELTRREFEGIAEALLANGA